MRWRDIKQGKKQDSKVQKVRIVENEKEFATILDKSKAFLTDSFMLLMPIMYIVFYLIMGSREEFRDHMLTGWVYIIIPHMIVTVLFWRIKGQTPGMKAYHLEVVEVNSGKRPNISMCFLRYILTAISFFSIIGFLIAYFRKDRRTLQDLLSGTYIKTL